MKFSGKRKACIAVALLALAAFLVDRLLLGYGDGQTSPSRSKAAEVAAPLERPTAAPAQAQAKAAVSSRQHGPSLADRLEAAGQKTADLSAVRDAFRPAPEWVAELRPEAQQVRTVSAAESFLHQHRLTAVMTDGNGGQAVVDGKCLRIGQEIDGFVLSSVGRRTAVFTSGEVSVELKLAEKSQADDRN